MTFHHLLTWLLTATALLEAECFTLVADNPYQQITLGRPYTIMCQAGVPLAGCQAKNLYPNDVYELNGGNSSAYYMGTGLGSGQCGFSIRKETSNVGQYWPISCRARAEDGGWQYADAVTQRADNSFRVLPVVTGPRSLIVDSGENVTLTFVASEALSQCGFSWPGQKAWQYGGATRKYSVDISQLAQGRCQLTLFNVKSETSGIVHSFVRSNFVRGVQGHFVKLTTIIVKQAPSAPELTFSKADGVFSEGDVMEASCYIGTSRPVARSSWLLGDDVIPGEAEVYSKWPWEHEAANVTRKLSRKLGREDDGKELACRVHHEALPGGETETRKKISIRASAQPPTSAVAAGRSTECGQRGTKPTTIAGGQEAGVAEFPWHVAVYKDQADGYEQICGGSLITRVLIVSAAHCFWDDSLMKQEPITAYKIVLGKHHRAWTHKERLHQVIDVAKVHLPPRYRGSISNYQYDIAVVRLATAAVFSTSVKPICVDWKNQFGRRLLTKDTVGTMAGWGFTHDGTQASKLQMVDLPLVNFSTCYDALPEGTHELYTEDKFCAGFANRSKSACPGDSGGGLVVRHTDNRYYLRGVASVSFRPVEASEKCYSQYYNGFTNFNHYSSWIRGFDSGGCPALPENESVELICMMGVTHPPCQDPEPGTMVPADTNAVIECSPGYRLPTPPPKYSIISCVEGVGWSRPLFSCVPA